MGKVSFPQYMLASLTDAFGLRNCDERSESANGGEAKWSPAKRTPRMEAKPREADGRSFRDAENAEDTQRNSLCICGENFWTTVTHLIAHYNLSKKIVQNWKEVEKNIFNLAELYKLRILSKRGNINE